MANNIANTSISNIAIRNIVGRQCGEIHSHSLSILRKDCNIVNSTSCLTITLLVICVVVGG